ncbi:hypothetical protein L596_009080 [Steinernema carpocapsae]|uniref:choline-phosphate cytidylyltransferase n=1 Tax=Steinernema carpocapsae TaxID=34508 RepID=A0A4V6A6I2_STECR|nr:hypothetical protein L596_009080 [Steinernema carpocapsae]
MNSSPALLSTDKEAISIRESIVPFRRITLVQASSDSAGRPVRVVADGIFDLFHVGHGNLFKQIKQAFPNAYLIVVIYDDEQTRKHKGPTVQTQRERVEALRHIKYVDEVMTKAPWGLSVDFCDQNKIDIVAHDDGNKDPCLDVFRNKKMFLQLKRTGGVSTSSFITRILKNRDVFFDRNLARGVPRQELGLSLFYVGFKI